MTNYMEIKKISGMPKSVAQDTWLWNAIKHLGKCGYIELKHDSRNRLGIRLTQHYYDIIAISKANGKG